SARAWVGAIPQTPSLLSSYGRCHPDWAPSIGTRAGTARGHPSSTAYSDPLVLGLFVLQGPRQWTGNVPYVTAPRAMEQSLRLPVAHATRRSGHALRQPQHDPEHQEG